MPSCPSRSTSWTSSTPWSPVVRLARPGTYSTAAARSCGSRSSARTALAASAPIAVTVRRALEHAVRREDRHAGIARADQDGEQIGAVLRPVLLVERQRGLVAVVAVSDEQLTVGEGLSELLVGEPPQARPVDLEVGHRGGHLERRGTVIEQEDRLDVRTHGAQQPEPALRWASVRPLVGQDDPPLVRHDPKCGREAGARARDAVRSDVVLRQRPEGGGLFAQGALSAPFA